MRTEDLDDSIVCVGIDALLVRSCDVNTASAVVADCRFPRMRYGKTDLEA